VEDRQVTEVAKSDKSFVLSVVLAAVFGILGVHHFYVGRVFHGLFDLCLSLVGFSLLVLGFTEPRGSYVAIGALILLADYIHSVYFIYRLIVGTYADGKGRRVSFE
jgi:TM2 domain-containing membrane protein YozV